MYDFLRGLFPTEVFHAGGVLNDAPLPGDKNQENNSHEHTPLIEKSKSTTIKDNTVFSYCLKNLWLWRRRTWAHYRGFGIELVDEEGNLLYDDRGNPLVSHGFSPQITVEEINNQVIKNKGRPVFLVERPSEYAYLNVNSFEVVSDLFPVGAHNGLVLAISILTNLFTPLKELQFVFGAMALEALFRVSFNWFERNNANNINTNKNQKTLSNTAIFLLSSLCFIALFFTNIAIVQTVLPVILFIPVGIAAWRVKQQMVALYENLKRMYKTWHDPFEFTRYRKQTFKRFLQFGGACLSFLLITSVATAIGMNPGFQAKVSIYFVVGSLCVQGFSFLREFSPFNTLLERYLPWLFPGEQIQRDKLNEETLSAKIMRYMGNPLENFGVVRRKKFHHLGAFNQEFAAIHNKISKGVPEKEAHATAIILLVKSEQGIESKIGDYVKKAKKEAMATGLDFQRLLDEDPKYLFLTQISHILLEKLPALDVSSDKIHEERSALAEAKHQWVILNNESIDNPDDVEIQRKRNEVAAEIIKREANLKKLEASHCISYQLNEARGALTEAENKRVLLKIALLKNSKNSTEEDNKKERKSQEKRKENLEKIERQLLVDPYKPGDLKRVISLCRTPHDFEHFFKVNPTIKLDIFAATRKISHCEAYYQAWVTMTQLFPDRLNPQLDETKPTEENTDLYIRTLGALAKDATVIKHDLCLMPETNNPTLEKNTVYFALRDNGGKKEIIYQTELKPDDTVLSVGKNFSQQNWDELSKRIAQKKLKKISTSCKNALLTSISKEENIQLFECPNPDLQEFGKEKDEPAPTISTSDTKETLIMGDSYESPETQVKKTCYDASNDEEYTPFQKQQSTDSLVNNSNSYFRGYSVLKPCLKKTSAYSDESHHPTTPLMF